MKYGRACFRGVSVSSPVSPPGPKGRAFWRQLCETQVALLLLSIATSGCSGATTTTPSSDKEEEPGEDGDIPVLPPGEGSSQQRTEPGSVGLRRLSKYEYNNTLAHLFGLKGDATALFPSEPSALGFDNVTAAQSTSATFVSAHTKAVEDAVAAIAAGKTDKAAMWRIDCDLASDAACASRLLKDLALKAWRRPPAEQDVDKLVKIYEAAKSEGLAANEAMGTAISAVLMSPRFLFRVEHAGKDAEVKRLDPYEDATRLSYFLWSSTPDVELLKAAADGDLSNQQSRRAHIVRMMADPRAKGFVSNFLGQWLLLRKLRDHTVEASIMKDWSATMVASITGETETFFQWALQNGGLQDLILSRKAFVDASLARHYGIEPPSQPGGATTLKGERQGLLGHASVLTATSHAGSTSPVLRGKFILEQMLCEHLPAPPANVSPLSAVGVTGTVRQRLEAHRKEASCKGCHQVLDPMGLALETFDAVGRARTQDAGQSIDTSGTLPEGQKFANTTEMIELLAADQRLGRCLTKQLYVFALGRAVETADDHMDPAVLKSLEEPLIQDNGALADLIIGIAEAPTFRFRRFD